MLFNSLEFVIFFPAVFIFYYALSHKYRWLLLLAASYYFYMCWRVEYILLILASTGIDYYAAHKMAETENEQKRKKWLYLSLVVNLGFLFSFKYFNFLGDSVQLVFDRLNIFYNVPHFDVLLPVGISFYTFQTLSYTIDVYRRKTKPEKHIGKFALYVAFFPQLVAGPIERSTRLLPQFSKEVSYDNSQIVSGLRLMLWGFFKKLVVADRLGIFVGEVFNDAQNATGYEVLLGAFLLHIQVYTDLSGYTDIARGAARTLGFNLIKNFNLPLFSKSIYDFWKRWHISLTRWFTDYLYIPLGGNRVIKWRWYYNIFIVFVISGIWHGANWTFVIWGVLHGLYQLVEIWTDKPRHKFFSFIGLSKLPGFLNFISIIFVLSLVSSTAIFFGSKTIADSFLLISNIGSDLNLISLLALLKSNIDLQLGLISVSVLFLIEFLQLRYNLLQRIIQSPKLINWFIYILIVFSILAFGVFGEKEFIYFEF